VIQHDRIAHARISGENLFVVLALVAPTSQKLKPPAIPGTVRSPVLHTSFSMLARSHPKTRIYLLNKIAALRVGQGGQGVNRSAAGELMFCPLDFVFRGFLVWHQAI
jgi:hypothetical protein